MPTDFTSVHNVQERAVFDEVLRLAAQRPESTPALHPHLLADVACVALNRLPARYIRFDVDWSFYQTESEREEHARLVHAAVAQAFDQVVESLRSRQR